jgi:hypothetical protein
MEIKSDISPQWTDEERLMVGFVLVNNVLEFGTLAHGRLTVSGLQRLRIVRKLLSDPPEILETHRFEIEQQYLESRTSLPLRGMGGAGPS